MKSTIKSRAESGFTLIELLIVVAMLSGIIGVGLYPLGGTRVWCRNFCPMAAMLGLVQKFGRYRITVKENMCISCGLCSKYCEMGIDVRSYAQSNTSFTRASCWIWRTRVISRAAPPARRAGSRCRASRT